MDSDVQLVFGRAEAVVLFEFVSRYVDTGELTLQDQAEQRVLWDLQAHLERILTEHLDPDYSQTLKHARDKVRDLPS